MSHTPGPWQAWEPLRNSRHRPITQAPNGQTIAYVQYSQSMPVDANARLIASAPELLAALKEARRCLAYHVGKDQFSADIAAVEQAEAAIAKAEGAK